MTERSGQVMLITVMVISATILAATTIGGLITILQLRQTNDAQNSAKAIFAADAAIEWGLFQAYESSTASTMEGPVTLINDAEVEAFCYSTTTPSGSSDEVDCLSPASPIRSVEGYGTSKNVKRAFRQILP